jgi:glycosyltransferase involved in cell wall biosynthesis
LKAVPPTKEISILLPAYNEAWRIANCIKTVEKAVSAFFSSYEIIVTEDGSTDGTEAIVTCLQKTNPNLTLLHSHTRLGKGKAIKNALCKAKGRIIVFMDVDLATNLKYLPQLVHLVQNNPGLAIGSRYAVDSKVKRPISRTLFSLSYNLFVRALFFDGVHDHQCGFKAMSRDFVDVIDGSVKSDGWFFDTELILNCKKLGFQLSEMGVEWTEPRKQKESKVRLLHDASQIGMDLLRFRFRTL